MINILGIDAAWTAKEPSGVALIQAGVDRQRVLAVAPSYESFIRLGEGLPVDWAGPTIIGSAPNMHELLEAAKALGATEVHSIALDIPLARGGITGRRASDSAISKAFGGKGCAAHSPSETRPGPIADSILHELVEKGYSLDTGGSSADTEKSVLEVYPHPALLSLLNCDYRVPYKVAKSGKYWKGESVSVRIGNLLRQFSDIYAALQDELGRLPFELPAPESVRSLSQLKRVEDALDAVVCAWVGYRHSLGRTRAYGDSDSAIWVPV